ncbi:Ig-like domain-containing protein [bacterium]|nr:Ig-like domain-containing protein [bacterium]
MSWSIDVGTIVDYESVTDDVGEAKATIRSSTNHETGTVWAEAGSLGGGCYVEYADEDDPYSYTMDPNPDELISYRRDPEPPLYMIAPFYNWRFWGNTTNSLF